MKSKLKTVFLMVAAIATGLVAGCGGSGGGTASTSGAAPATAATAPNTTSSVSSQADILYAGNCADCHGALNVSTKKGITLARLQNAIANNIGGMGFLSALSAADQQTIVTALASTTSTATPTATPTPTQTPTPTTTIDGATLYAANCAGCHDVLASSAKQGATAAQIQIRMYTTPYATRTLTPAEVQAIADALAGTPPTTSTPPPTTTTPPPTTTTVDGAALYTANCASCHGALASSAKRGATAAQIQVRMYTTPYATRTLTPAEVQAIADALAAAPTTTTPPPTTTTPPPTTAVCGSCHAIPPATGKHAFHASQRVTCATCHGTGYSTTTVNAATHNNGVKNLTTTIGWNTTNRSCSNSCHGSKSW